MTCPTGMANVSGFHAANDVPEDERQPAELAEAYVPSSGSNATRDLGIKPYVQGPITPGDDGLRYAWVKVPNADGDDVAFFRYVKKEPSWQLVTSYECSYAQKR